MKSVLVLVVILHLCNSFNTSLNAELITELRTLKLQLNRIKLTSPVYVPSKHMSENPHDCAGVFFRELKVVLNNLLAHKQVVSQQVATESIQMLLANLDSLGPIPEDNHNCRMETWSQKRLPVNSYIDFITKLSKLSPALPVS